MKQRTKQSQVSDSIQPKLDDYTEDLLQQHKQALIEYRKHDESVKALLKGRRLKSLSSEEMEEYQALSTRRDNAYDKMRHLERVLLDNIPGASTGSYRAMPDQTQEVRFAVPEIRGDVEDEERIRFVTILNKKTGVSVEVAGMNSDVTIGKLITRYLEQIDLSPNTHVTLTISRWNMKLRDKDMTVGEAKIRTGDLLLADLRRESELIRYLLNVFKRRGSDEASTSTDNVNRILIAIIAALATVIAALITGGLDFLKALFVN